MTFEQIHHIVFKKRIISIFNSDEKDSFSFLRNIKLSGI